MVINEKSEKTHNNDNAVLYEYIPSTNVFFSWVHAGLQVVLYLS